MFDVVFNGIIARAGMKKEKPDLIEVSERGVDPGWVVLRSFLHGSGWRTIIILYVQC
jgi:hypothetical protein